MQYQPSSQQNEQELSNASSFSLDDIPKPELSGHAWLQRGPYIECQSCTFKHSSHIGTDLQLIGMSQEGYPLFRKIVVKH